PSALLGRLISSPTRRSSDLRAAGLLLQDLLEQRAQVDEMGREAEVFLGDLELHHQRRLRRGAEQRAEGFARHEIERAALHLHDEDRKSTRLNSSHVKISYAV